MSYNFADDDDVFSDYDDYANAPEIDYFDDDDTDTKKGSTMDKAKAIFRSSRWHRKILVALLVVVLVLLYLWRENKIQPHVQHVVNDVHGWNAWVRSSAGTGFIATIAGLIALDIAVDLAFGVWMNKHHPGKLY